MKKFIKTLGAFALLTLLLAIGLDYVITKGLHHYTMYETEVWNDLRSPDVHPDVIVLGSCQAMYDYNPIVLDSVLHCNSYVYAMSNLTFPCHNFMWNMYKKYNSGRMPKLVILTLDYGDLANKKIKGTEDCSQFLHLTDDSEARMFMLGGGYSLHDVYLPCYRYYGNHMMIKHGIISFFTHKGGSRQHIKGHVGLHSEYNAHSEWFSSPSFVEIDTSVVLMLDDFVADCQEQGIQLIITIAPLGLDCAKSITNLNEVYDTYYAIADKYGIILLDYSKHELTHDTRNFESPFHLNDFAADEFSSIVAQKIDSLKLYH